MKGSSIIKVYLKCTIIICSVIFFACTNKNSESSIDKDNEFSLFAKTKNENINNIKDIYENVEYVKYVDLDKYYEFSKVKNNDKVILYEGNIEYYDKDDKLIKKDENIVKLLSAKDGNLGNEEIDSFGYLINAFGMYELDGGFYKFSDNYYYVSDETHKVVRCSNATISNAIRKNKRKIISKDDDRYIVYDDKDRNGEFVKNSISNIDGEVYLSDENGKIISDEGIHHISNIYDDTLHLIYEGIDDRVRKVNDKEYYCYVNKDGKVVVGNKILIGDKTYIADPDGFLVKDAYLFTGIKLNKDMIYEGSDNLDNFDLKLIYNMINNKSVVYDKDYVLYDSIIASNSNVIDYFSGLKYTKDVYAYKDNRLIINDIVNYRNEKYYADNNGKFICDKVITDYKYKILLSNDGRVVRDRWIFDKQFYENLKYNSDIAPYIIGYDVNRDIIKPYLGFYILPTGEIFTENFYIESALFDKNKNVITKFKVKNGEYDGKYDSYIYKLNTFKNNEGEYNYEEYDEGRYAYVHRYTDDSRSKRIDDSDIDLQLKYRKILFEYDSYKDDESYKETVYFGRYYDHDMDGIEIEPIEWDIIEKKDGMALLISHKIIDELAFDTKGNNNWEDSSLRKWLNDDFINMAFTDEEKDRIKENSRENGRKGTNDKIFLLSSDEYEEYFEEYNEKNDGNLFNFVSKMIFPITNYLKKNKESIEYYHLMTSFWFRGEDIPSDFKEEYKYNYNVCWNLGSKFIKKTNSVDGVRPSIWVEYNDN